MEIKDSLVLKTISNILAVPPAALTAIYLKIKDTDLASESDLSQLFSMGIPIYQAIFSLAKSQKIQHDFNVHIRFSEIKMIMFSLIEEHGLLSHKLNYGPRSRFSESESTEIKRLLTQAREMNRKDRQDILFQLRVQYGFFPSHLTKSRARFDDKKFDQLVVKGVIIIT
jgi:hypothetical protein